MVQLTAIISTHGNILNPNALAELSISTQPCNIANGVDGFCTKLGTAFKEAVFNEVALTGRVGEYVMIMVTFGNGTWLLREKIPTVLSKKFNSQVEAKAYEIASKISEGLAHSLLFNSKFTSQKVNAHRG